MKKLLPFVLLLAGIASAQAATVSADAIPKADCFRLHGQLMEKPALKNEGTCWYVHSYLMNRT
jgi:hypothetical protein